MNKEDKLYTYWQTHINSKFLYRVVSDEYIQSIQKSGIDLNKNPFENKKENIEKLFKICLDLKKKGFLMMRIWGRPVDQEAIIKCSREDLKSHFIDFTPNFENKTQYYLNLKGGALMNTIYIFTEEILLKKINLNDEEIKIVKKLNKYSKNKIQFNNSIICISRSNKIFEDAKFQYFPNGKYIQSPFGSFEHFKKVISKNGLDFYKEYIEEKKLFYLRVKEKIKSEDITNIKKRI